jgi:hypothetical protein
MKLRSMLLVAGIVAAMAPIGANANHCDSNVVIFSGIKGAPKVNSGAAICLATSLDPAAEDVDGRLINPGSNEISLRYTQDLGVESLTAVLSGLGFEDREVTLNRGPATTGGFYYNSAGIDLDPSQVGCITATVIIDENDPEGGTDSNSFHTLGATC